MAREIKIHTWCDVCLDNDRREPAVSEGVGLAGLARSLDLCEQCDKTGLGIFRQWLADLGHRDAPQPTPAPTRQGRAPDRPRDIVCVWCDATYASTTGLARHLTVVHGFPAGAFDQASIGQAYGHRCPWCGERLADLRSGGNHIRAVHPDSPTIWAAAFTAAKAAGDPAGVVADVMATAPGGTYAKTTRQARRKPS